MHLCMLPVLLAFVLFGVGSGGRVACQVPGASTDGTGDSVAAGEGAGLVAEEGAGPGAGLGAESETGQGTGPAVEGAGPAVELPGVADPVDSLFDEPDPPSGDAQGGEGAASSPVRGASTVLADLQKARRFEYRLKAVAFSAAAAGWNSTDSGSPGSGFLVGAPSYAGGLGVKFSASFDARPGGGDKPGAGGRPGAEGGLGGDARIHGSFSYAIPLATFAVEELFLDTRLGTAFLRAGRQRIVWGKGVVFAFNDVLALNEDRAAGDCALRLSVPFGGTTLTGAGLYQVAGGLTLFDPGRLYAAVRVDGSSGLLAWELSGRVRGTGEGVVSGSVAGSVRGWDMFVQGRFDSAAASGAAQGGWGLYGLGAGIQRYYEKSGLGLVAEVLYRGSGGEAGDPEGFRTAVVAGMKPVSGSGITGGLQWLHCVADGSGSVAGLVKIPLAPGLVLDFALPASYGDEGSAFGRRYPATWELPLDWDGGRRLALFVRLSTTVEY